MRRRDRTEPVMTRGGAIDYMRSWEQLYEAVNGSLIASFARSMQALHSLVKVLHARWQELRAEKNYAEADALRELMVRAGLVVSNDEVAASLLPVNLLDEPGDPRELLPVTHDGNGINRFHPGLLRRPTAEDVPGYVTHTFEDKSKAGLWYLVYEDVYGTRLYEAWAWEAQDAPPTDLGQLGWRYREIGLLDTRTLGQNLEHEAS